MVNSFINVLNMNLTASYVIVFIMIVRLPLKKVPKIISYVSWCVAAFRLVCPISFESIVSLLPTNASPIPPDIGYQQIPQINSGITAFDTYINSSLPTPIAESSINPIQSYTRVGGYIWIFGIITMVVYSIASMVILKYKLKSADNIEKNIYVANNLKTPFVLGIINPKIFLPSGLTDNEKNYILRHEQTHIRRKDPLIKQLAFWILCIHWLLNQRMGSLVIMTLLLLLKRLMERQ